MIVVKKRSKGLFGEPKLRATIEIDKDELDLMVWSLEAFVARSGGQSVHRFALDTLDGLKSVYKMADK